MSGGGSLRRVRFLAAAADDVRAIAQRSRPVLVEVFRLLLLLDRGSISATPLQDLAKTGDLRDCGKLVVAVEGRTGDLPYLLAGLRLGRLEDPVRRSEEQRRVARIRRLVDRD